MLKTFHAQQNIRTRIKHKNKEKSGKQTKTSANICVCTIKQTISGKKWARVQQSGQFLAKNRHVYNKVDNFLANFYFYNVLFTNTKLHWIKRLMVVNMLQELMVVHLKIWSTLMNKVWISMSIDKTTMLELLCVYVGFLLLMLTSLLLYFPPNLITYLRDFLQLRLESCTSINNTKIWNYTNIMDS